MKRADLRKTWCDKKKNVFYVDEDFFKNWTVEMAYILGFFAADGCLAFNRKRRNKYIEFSSTDYEIIQKIKQCLKSSHTIGSRIGKPNCKTAYRLQIGSKIMFQDLIEMGFVPRKSNVLQFPAVPSQYLSHFIRGYFDGDGHSTFCHFNRKERSTVGRALMSGFTSGSKDFLVELRSILQKNAHMTLGTLCFHLGYRLVYSSKDSYKLFKFMYEDRVKSLYLERKYLKFKSELEKFGLVV